VQLARSDPPLDHKLTRRRFSIAQQINNALPTWLSSSVSSLVLDAQMRKAFPQLKDEWRLLPAPPLANHPGTINNHIIDKFASEEVMNLGRIVEFTSHGIVTVEEGEIACDAVIFATGSKFNYGFLAPEADPTAFPTPEWDAHPNSQGLQYPRLYRTLFHPHHLDSLALFGPCRGFTFAAFSNADLVSQAIAQLWAGRHPMPSPAEVDRWCDDNYRFSLQQIQPHRIPKVGSKAGEFE
jgi:dimethylaniline monooxygenase (N-oxide forming)